MEHPEDVVRLFLKNVVGEDIERDGTRDTPKRVVKAWKEEWGGGYSQNVSEVLTTFTDGAEGCGDEIILVSNLPVYSHCEHHLALFWGLAHIGYLPGNNILGLSKFARVVNIFAHRLQVQERLTNQVADALWKHLKPKAVGVIFECRHACMESRGVHARGSITTTSALRGEMKTDTGLRQEFLQLVLNASSTRNGI